MKTVKTLLLVPLIAVSLVVTSGSQHNLVFECGSIFNAETTLESLIQEFGAVNVIEAEIHEDEGFYEHGALIFPGSQAELQVFWHDPETRQSLRKVRVQGDHSAWQTPDGLKLGLDLQSIEAINRRPFRLVGFGWDYGGTVGSWENGDLGASSSESCRLVVRLGEDSSKDSWEVIRKHWSVNGSDTFSSGHPTMQLMNPKIRELSLFLK